MTLQERIHELLAELEAKGWPTLSENPDLCMERAFEFVGRFTALIYEEEK